MADALQIGQRPPTLRELAPARREPAMSSLAMAPTIYQGSAMKTPRDRARLAPGRKGAAGDGFPGERLGSPSLEIVIHALWTFAREPGQSSYCQGFALFGGVPKGDTRNDSPPLRLKKVAFSNGSPVDNDFVPI